MNKIFSTGHYLSPLHKLFSANKLYYHCLISYHGRTMLPKKKRLDTNSFDFVYKNGKNVNGSVGYLKVMADFGRTSVACTTGKKQTKNSTDRTRIRRRGYAAAAESFDLISDGTAVIWFLPPDAKDLAFSELKNAFKKMIESLSDV